MTLPAHAESQRVAIYFVASPLQYLAARRIAEHFEQGARQIIVYYKHGVAPIVRAEEWDAAAYMPWPRFEPLHGPFGRLRRLRKNLHDVADLVGSAHEIHLHSAVFDTEAINYFVRGLPRLTGATILKARILPDGIISIRRYPLSALKRIGQCLRKLRRLVAPELEYSCFSGDRIGSDATFVDRIYIQPSIPHQYSLAKVVMLPPLVERDAAMTATTSRALVIGQPLSGAGLMSPAQSEQTGREIEAWLKTQGATEVHYKAHPKDPNRELFRPDYQLLELNEPLESYMARNAYAYIIGVRSTVLFLARELYGPDARILAFGLERVRFKSQGEKQDMLELMEQLNIEMQ
ncbi:MAG: polysialyltransferase family glycosyltransferase [Pseudomonadota bacterium]